MLRALFLSLILALGLIGPMPAHAAEPIHLVFDIDWTLVYPLPERPAKPDAHTVEALGKWYRFADDSAAIIAEAAANPNLRVSFFSGGEKERNLELLQKLKLPDGRSALDVATKVLSSDDLTPASSDPNAGFADRWKKDLTKIEPDLDRVVLVDDMADFSVPGQERNMYWLGETYNFAGTFEEAKARALVKAKYEAPTEAAWKWERAKLKRAFAFVRRAANGGSGDAGGFLARLHQLRSVGDCPLLFDLLTP